MGVVAWMGLGVSLLCLVAAVRRPAWARPATEVGTAAAVVVALASIPGSTAALPVAVLAGGVAAIGVGAFLGLVHPAEPHPRPATVPADPPGA